MPAATEPSRSAGDFSAWLRHTRRALQEDVDTDVACGDCIGCCSSSYLIPLRPDEHAALKLIPATARMPAPGQPGHQLVDYDVHGHCPMLSAGRCTIYADRPRTCRTYDCRVFTAAGIAAGGAEKTTINERVRSWRFAYPAECDRLEHEAVQRTARFIRQNAHDFPGGRAAHTASQVAILAIKAYSVMLDPGSEPEEDSPGNAHIARAIIEACREFDARRQSVARSARA